MSNKTRQATDTEVENVIAWCLNRQDRGETYRGMTFEEGVIMALEWARDADNYPKPDDE